MIKVLNLYSGIGGNRKLWKDVKVVAVEIDRDIANIYRYNFPNDEIIIGDAHQFLLENYKEFDFIWSSPPCPSHSRARYWGFKNTNPIYPDMKLYQEIIFLKHYYNGNWIIENVIPYYDFLIKPTVILNRHAFWSNKSIPQKSFNLRYSEIKDNLNKMEEKFGIYIGDMVRGDKKRKVLRNCVYPEIGLYLFNVVNKGYVSIESFK